MRSTAVVLVWLASAACGGNARGEVGQVVESQRQLIVALDLSGSQSEHGRAQARQALELVIEDLQFGDRIVLLQVHQRSAVEDAAVRWAENVASPENGSRPTSLDRERLDAVKQAARSVARAIFENEDAGQLPTTDLFATLHIAAEYVRDEPARHTTLVLLSDMLQSAHGVEMGRDGGVPPPGWLAQQRQAGLLPGLAGVCVVVVGADATTPNGVAVRNFWLDYFENAGATLAERNYRLIATDPSAVTCARPEAS